MNLPLRLRTLGLSRNAASTEEVAERVLRIKKARVGDKRDQAVLEAWEALAPEHWQGEGCPHKSRGGFLLSPQKSARLDMWPSGLSLTAFQWVLTHVREVEHVRVLLKECEVRTQRVYEVLNRSMKQWKKQDYRDRNRPVEEWSNHHDNPPVMWLYNSRGGHEEAGSYPWKAAYQVWDVLISMRSGSGDDAVLSSVQSMLNGTVNNKPITPGLIQGLASGFEKILDPSFWKEVDPRPSVARQDGLGYVSDEQLEALREACLNGSMRNPYDPMVEILRYGILPMGTPSRDNYGCYEVVFPAPVRRDK